MGRFVPYATHAASILSVKIKLRNQKEENSMKKRKRILQEHKPDADWAVLENVVHQDEIMRLSTVEYARSAEAFGADYIPVGDAPFIAGWLKKIMRRIWSPLKCQNVCGKGSF